MSKAAARKAAQRAVKMKACEICGAKDVKLNRHHVDYNNYTKVIVVCTKCHAKIHAQGKKKMQKCVICGKMFMSKDSHLHKTCSPQCLKELGRKNAMKRWGNGKQSQMCQESQTA